MENDIKSEIIRKKMLTSISLAIFTAYIILVPNFFMLGLYINKFNVVLLVLLFVLYFVFNGLINGYTKIIDLFSLSIKKKRLNNPKDLIIKSLTFPSLIGGLISFLLLVFYEYLFISYDGMLRPPIDYLKLIINTNKYILLLFIIILPLIVLLYQYIKLSEIKGFNKYQSMIIPSISLLIFMFIILILIIFMRIILPP